MNTISLAELHLTRQKLEHQKMQSVVGHDRRIYESWLAATSRAQANAVSRQSIAEGELKSKLLFSPSGNHLRTFSSVAQARAAVASNESQAQGAKSTLDHHVRKLEHTAERVEHARSMMHKMKRHAAARSAERNDEEISNYAAVAYEPQSLLHTFSINPLRSRADDDQRVQSVRDWNLDLREDHITAVRIQGVLHDGSDVQIAIQKSLIGSLSVHVCPESPDIRRISSLAANHLLDALRDQGIRIGEVTVSDSPVNHHSHESEPGMARGRARRNVWEDDPYADQS